MSKEHKTIAKAAFTWAIPGYWLEFEGGEREFSAYGVELTEKQKKIVHAFPVGTFKTIN